MLSNCGCGCPAEFSPSSLAHHYYCWQPLRQRIYFDNSTVLIQDTSIYVQTVFDNSRFELSNIELEVSDNNGIFLGTKSEGSIKSSILFAGSFENKRSTIECTQSSLTLLDTRVFLDNDEEYINACYLKIVPYL